MNTGEQNTCTVFALTKAIANGHMTKKFVSGVEIDFDPNGITAALLNHSRVSIRP